MPKQRVQHGAITVRQEHPSSGTIAGAITEHRWEPGDPVPPGATLHQRPSIDLRWNRDAGWVQLGFAAPREWWETFHQGLQESPDEEYSAFTDVLSRKDINAMIRTLRRARDSAYGTDE